MQAKHLINMTPPPTGCPIGTVVAWMAWSGGLANISSDWLIANGGSLQKALYLELFAVIGYTYGGSGDYFILPNLTDGKFLEYRTTAAGTVKKASLPNITGYFRTEAQVAGHTGGAWYGGAFKPAQAGHSHLASAIDPGNSTGYTFDASLVSSIYNGSTKTVQPYSMTVIPIIKVK